MSSLPRVDWATAAATAGRLTPPGSAPAPAEASAVVADLREASVRAQTYVRDITRMDPPGQRRTYVVDRPSWVRANLGSFAEVFTDPADPAPRHAIAPPSVSVERVRAVSTGAMAGAVLAALSPRVLGQFDVFHGLSAPAGERGRLLLVAPNIHGIGQRLGLEGPDFRLWVCLHEETHRVQYGQAPWLAGHLAQLVRTALTGDHRAADAATDAITALMSVVEGHADVVMDEVGPQVIPTLRTIRDRFDKRREGRPGLARILGRLLGMEKKLAQYREGAVFCRSVQRLAGVEGFNRVFDGPDQLPTLGELRDPDRWVRRVTP
ncbi:zinc-dependent metalloprotease [Raineyella fluvialis]|uniref:Coenzyme F420 biosynthesis-associated protein n=1 Tax=Raineyella fluvialis TaxID=2662261 RepID=A0A5Q2FB34_9ACTN|nr:zinc-dependent metalloprotease [Raineyella fluvialis]QGF23928.1 coenzyme F420 biosynthesis-associated protein [Raineyella fluvialis]